MNELEDIYHNEEFNKWEILIHPMEGIAYNPLFSHCSFKQDIWIHGIPHLLVYPVASDEVEVDNDGNLMQSTLDKATSNWFEIHWAQC